MTDPTPVTVVPGEEPTQPGVEPPPPPPPATEPGTLPPLGDDD